MPFYTIYSVGVDLLASVDRIGFSFIFILLHFFSQPGKSKAGITIIDNRNFAAFLHWVCVSYRISDEYFWYDKKQASKADHSAAKLSCWLAGWLRIYAVLDEIKNEILFKTSEKNSKNSNNRERKRAKEWNNSSNVMIPKTSQAKRKQNKIQSVRNNYK